MCYTILCYLPRYIRKGSMERMLSHVDIIDSQYAKGHQKTSLQPSWAKTRGFSAYLVYCSLRADDTTLSASHTHQDL